MRNLVDILNENLFGQIANTCESFADKRLYQIQKDLQSVGLKWNNVFGSSFISLQWDKIGADQIEELDRQDIDDFLKRCRRIKAGKDERPVVAFCYINEKLSCIYDPIRSHIFLTDVDSVKRYKQWRTVTTSTPRGLGEMKQTEMYDCVKDADYVIVVYADKNTADQMISDRRHSKQGMLPDLNKTDHQSRHTIQGVVGKVAGGLDLGSIDYRSFYRNCVEMARSAETERKNIIAKNKFVRDADTTKIDKIVENATRLLLKFSMWATKNNFAISTDDFVRISYIVTSNSFYNYNGYQNQEGILKLYEQYCGTILNLRNPNYKNKELANDTRERLAAKIEELYNNFVKKCADYNVKL